MGFEFYKESYAGTIREISIGEGSKSVNVGGESCYPFHQFEGKMPYKPRIAMEIWDVEPDDWPEAVLIPFKDVVHDVAAWAKKCVDEYKADIIVLQLKSTDPNGMDSTPEEAVAKVKKVLNAIDVPVIVWGVANAEKDEVVFKKIAEECQKSSLILGPVEDKNYKSVGAAAMGYGHLLISSSPIDVNLAKQVNILLENLGMPMDKILIDPTTGGLGYGLEYSYSVMERLRMAALTQGDDKLQMPIVNNLGNEIWKCKEVKQGVSESPLLGDPEKRGILMESVAAVTYLMAGSNILIMRHPESIKMVKSYIDLIMDGGNGKEVLPISKKLKSEEVDIISLSPNPNLSIEKSNDKGKEKPVNTSLKTEKKKKVKKVESLKVSKNDKKSDLVVETIKESGNKLKEVVVKAETKVEEVVVKDETKVEEVVVKAETKVEEVVEQFDNKKDVEVKVKIEEDELLSKQIQVEEDSIREKRLAERGKVVNTKSKHIDESLEVKKTAASKQLSERDKMLDKLRWVHRLVKLYKW